ncbi:MAG TPA: hypothetical protein P5055_13175, partial [Candidatus Paceibacterota bacterium]|nr:hypothetical protein [Candidatus Paceibacterota bacterium]
MNEGIRAFNPKVPVFGIQVIARVLLGWICLFSGGLTQAARGQSPPPHLQIQRAGTNLTLFWPLSATGFGLQHASHLTPVPSWRDVTVMGGVNGASHQVQMPGHSPQGYYRLNSGRGFSVLVVEQRSGTVSLPEGSGIRLSDLRVMSSLGSAPVTSQGKFRLPVFHNTPHLAMVLGPNGQPMLMGWLEAGHGELSARTTAEALLFFTGGFFILPQEARRQAIERIRGMTELGALETAIRESLAADAEAMAFSNPPVQQALVHLFKQLGFVEQTPSGNRIQPSGIILDPNDEQSGIRVNLTGVNGIRLHNRFRRCAYVFVDRDSYLGMDDKWHESPAALTEFEVASVAGLNSTVGALVDIINGKMAYTEVTSAPVVLPVLPGSRITRYKVNVIGPGQIDYRLRFLPPAEQAKHAPFVLAWFARDIFLPFLTSVIIPNLNIDGDYARFLSSNDSLVDYVNFMTATAPSLAEKVKSGDLEGAFSEALSTFISSTTFQKKSLDLVMDIIEMVSPDKAMSGAEALGMAQKVLNAVGWADKILYAFDVFVTVGGLMDCHRGDQWTVDVSAPRVTLTPAYSEIAVNKRVLLTAAVPEATGTGAPTFVYHWNNSAKAGSIADTHHTGTDFDSSDDFVWYVADLGKPGTDTISVRIYELKGSDRIYVGETNATVKVLGTLVTVSPATVEIGAGTEIKLTGRLQPNPAVGSVLDFQWSNTAHHGSLVPSGPFAVYTAKPDGSGDDTVELEVFEVKAGKKESLGKGSARVSVRPYGVSLTPSEPTLGPGDMIPLITTLNPNPPANWSLIFQWSNTAGAGDLRAKSGPVNSFTNQEPSATYAARTNGRGTDTVMVSVYRQSAGSNVFVGTAVSRITVAPILDRLVVPKGTVRQMSGNYQFETAEIRGRIELVGDTTIEIVYGLKYSVSNTHPTFVLDSGDAPTGFSTNGWINCDFHANRTSPFGKGRNGYNLNLIVHGNFIVGGVFGSRIHLYGQHGRNGSQDNVDGDAGGNGGHLRLVVDGMIRTLSPDFPRTIEFIACGGQGGSGYYGQAATRSLGATQGGNGAPGGFGGSLHVEASEMYRVYTDFSYDTLNVSGGLGGAGGRGGTGLGAFPPAQGGDGANGGPAGSIELVVANRVVSQHTQGFTLEAIGGYGGNAGSPPEGYASRGIPGLSKAGHGARGGTIHFNAASVITLMARAMGGGGGAGSSGGIDWDHLELSGRGGPGGDGGAGGQVIVICDAPTYEPAPYFQPAVDIRG